MWKLLWLQSPVFLPGAGAALAEQLGGAGWGADALGRILQCLVRRCALCPDLAEASLEAARAVVAAHPGAAPVEAVVEVLKQAQRAGPAVRAATLAATHDLAAAAHGCARLEAALVHHLAENANFMTSEYAWETAEAEYAAARGGPGAAAASAAGRNPAMAAAVAALQRSTLTGAWLVRLAAVRGLATVAVRSGEPFRLQCYAALRAVVGAGLALEPEAAPVVETLDHMYRAQGRLAQMSAQFGAAPSGWSTGALAKVAGRHAVLLEACSRVCFLPRDRYLPLGAASVAVMQEFEARGGDAAAAAAAAAAGVMGNEAAAAAQRAAAKAYAGAAQQQPAPPQHGQHAQPQPQPTGVFAKICCLSSGA